MTLEAILNPKPGVAFMMSNEAMVRAALEAGVQYASFYPGSPTSEILEAMVTYGPQVGVWAEVATNEKVALEGVAGASMAGLRAFTSMKSVGMNVAADALFTLAYTGVKGGMVVITADDPFAHSSQNEQDGRLYAPAAYVPMIEPTDPQEAYEMVKWALDLSEQHGTLVLIRTTTRVNHQSGLVRFGPLERAPRENNDWSSVGRNYACVGPTARTFKAKLLERIAGVVPAMEAAPWNTVSEGEGKVGLIAAGIPAVYAREAMGRLGVRLPLLRLGTLYPLPEKKIAAFLRGLDTVVVLEELSPYIEKAVREIAKDVCPTLQIIGKKSGHLSEALEYNVMIVEKVLAGILGRPLSFDYDAHLAAANKAQEVLPVRAPTFCAGCPHRATLYAYQRATRRQPVVLDDDIGCYSMTILPPFNMGDSLICMGASLGLAAGQDVGLNDTPVVLMGDSTFFHAGIPGLVNAIHNKHNLLLILLDNRVTAMTGQQSHPGSDFAMGSPEDGVRLELEQVVRGLGVEPTIMSAFSVAETTATIQEALGRTGVRVLISRGPCALYNDRLKRRRGEATVPYFVNKEICHKCHTCMKMFYCPAIRMDEDDRSSRIDPTLCNGCGTCAQICPYDVIHRTGGCVEGETILCTAPSHKKEVAQ
jgi:indolepyruvate ferredoxin oxidoreductase alpha subunit